MILKNLILVSALLLSLSPQAEKVLECERSLTKAVTLLTPKNKYLSLNLPYGPAERLRKKIEALHPEIILQNRGEAHVTMLTPQEYELLSAKLSRKEILKIATASLKEDLIPICVGLSETLIAGKQEKTFYVVLESVSLNTIRKNLKSAYLENGGPKNKFRPDRFHPHITLGFTLRDLHEADGAVKDKTACVHPLSLL